MRIQNLNGPSTEQLYEEDVGMQAYEAVEETENDHGPRPNKQDPEQNAEKFSEDLDDSERGWWGRNSNQEKESWFKGFLRKSG